MRQFTKIIKIIAFVFVVASFIGLSACLDQGPDTPSLDDCGSVPNLKSTEVADRDYRNTLKEMAKGTPEFVVQMGLQAHPLGGYLKGGANAGIVQDIDGYATTVTGFSSVTESFALKVSQTLSAETLGLAIIPGFSASFSAGKNQSGTFAIRYKLSLLDIKLTELANRQRVIDETEDEVTGSDEFVYGIYESKVRLEIDMVNSCGEKQQADATVLSELVGNQTEYSASIGSSSSATYLIESNNPVQIGYLIYKLSNNLTPTRLQVSESNGQVSLSWNGVENSSGYTVFYSSLPGIDIENPATYIESDRVDTERYTRVLDAGNACFVVALRLGGRSTNPSVEACLFDSDNTAPHTASIQINRGAEKTSEALVSVAMKAQDDTGVAAYLLSENPATPNEDDNRWVLVSNATTLDRTASFTLAEETQHGTYLKTIYAWFKDSAGNVSTVVSDSISLEVEIDVTKPDTTAPYDVSVIINNGAASTEDASVQLKLSAQDDRVVSAYLVSEESVKPNAEDNRWSVISDTQSFSKTVNYALKSAPAAGNYSRTVFVWYKDAWGNISDFASDSITLIINTTGDQFEVEPNGSIEDAQRISSGSYIGEKGESSDYRDYYSIIAAGENLVFSLEHFTISERSDFQITVYSRELEVVYNTYSNNSIATHNTIGVVKDDLYFIQIRPGYIGYKYRLTVGFNDTPRYEKEPNGSFEDADSVGYFSVIGYENRSSDYSDYYLLTATKSSLELQFKHLTRSDRSDFRIDVYNEDLDVIRDRVYSNNSQTTLINLQTVVGKDYYVKVSSMPSEELKYELTFK